MLLAELTIGSSFTGDDGVKWILSEQLSDNDKIHFTLEKEKVAPKEEELLTD